ncbi:MAG: 2-hydroxyacyl-CoA dehydratase family protein [Candidatus Marinimicrobia bacterium]|nr:2-hydroxyacyl-CoA dehydratase family protein [Candidatus Neomarinimicrobiota bacterium]
MSINDTKDKVLKIPDRSDYLRDQRRSGQEIMGVLPALYPRELLWAFNILPAEIWDPPGEILLANVHLQASICPIVKRGLEFILKSPEIINSGYLFPHTCDSLQNLGTQVKDLIGVPVPVYTFYNPKGEFNKASKRYYSEILFNLQKTLEKSHGLLSQNQLKAACELGHKIDIRRQMLHAALMEDRFDLSNREYFQLIRAAEYMQGQDYLDLLNHVEINEQIGVAPRARLLVTGILPPGDDILNFLDESRVRIVSEDLLSGSRRIPIVEMDQPDDPMEYLVERFFLLPPCSTKAGGLDKRLQYLKKLIAKSRCHGVLFNTVKFCEPELFDQHFLIKSMKVMGLPVLNLETELQPGLSGQEKTRIEAFLEMLDEGVPV